MNKKSYAIYVRSVVGHQREISAVAQSVESKAIVSAMGWSLASEFKDVGVGGSQGADAPACDQFVERE